MIHSHVRFHAMPRIVVVILTLTSSVLAFAGPATTAPATAPATQSALTIAQDTAVKIDYTLTGPDGKVIDSSIGKKPLPYLQGHHNLIPGLEKQLEGKSAGDHLKVTIAPEDAYGVRNENLVLTVDKSKFPSTVNLQVGMKLRANTSAGPHMFTITKIDGDKITVDGNHPLAGVRLTFDVKIIDVRPGTPDEIAAGHILSN